MLIAKMLQGAKTPVSKTPRPKVPGATPKAKRARIEKPSVLADVPGKRRVSHPKSPRAMARHFRKYV